MSLLQDPFGLSYAVFVGLGGIIGFVKASSVPSLVAGLGSASVIVYGTQRVVRNSKDVGVILGISAFLLIFFLNRYRRSGKVMPAGIVSVSFAYPFMQKLNLN